MRKQILFTGLAMICLVANVSSLFSSENQKHKQTKRLRLGSFFVQGYWPISNSLLTNADVLTDPFGPRRTTTDTYDYHEGIDIRAQMALPVYAAFDGWIYRVEANSNNTVLSYIILRHVDPFDNTTFYTRYLHLTWTQDLADLNDLEEVSGHAPVFIDAPFNPQYYVTPNKSYIINPIATSGNSGPPPVAFHLHFEGMVGGTNPINNAINPMRDDSLPYTNSGPNHGAPIIQNIVLTTNPRRLTFRVSTHYQELDLNGITLFDAGSGDGIQIDFDNRTNTDAAGDPTGNTNEDGIINARTSFNASMTITIATTLFNPNALTNQIMDFAFTLPTAWRLNPLTIYVDDTQELFDQENVVPTSVADQRDNITLPSTYLLFQNFPNPFNPSTTIRFALPKNSNVSLTIFDANGRLVHDLATQKFYDAGWGELIWDGTSTAGLPVASGAYFYRLNAEGLDNKKLFSQAKKLLLVR